MIRRRSGGSLTWMSSFDIAVVVLFVAIVLLLAHAASTRARATKRDGEAAEKQNAEGR